jgi:hypothetical protein
VNTIAFRLKKPWAASPAMREMLLLCAVITATLGVELALVERKYAIFGGGFGQSQALSGAASIAAFSALLAASHALLLTLLFVALRGLHRRMGKSPLFPINFLVLVPAVAFAALAAKYQVLSYFSDAISFQLIRNLGGGSLFDALLFVLSEGALMAGGAIVALTLYWLALRWYLRRTGPRARESSGRLRIRLGLLLIWTLCVAIGLYAANQRADLQSALNRFNAPLLINGVLAEVTDFDRDGYGLTAQPADAWPFDGSRYPFALDIPGNGVDEDGIGGDFAFAGEAASEPGKVALPAKPRHLVLIVLESTRGDVLGRRFAGREVTPNLNALAAAGSAFPAAYSHVGFTTASLKSLFSGRLETKAGGPSLFRDLKRNGYRIGVFSGQPESFGDISEAVGMRAAADVFQDAETLKAERAFGFAAKGSLLVDGKVLLREFDRSFGKREAWDRPVFLYINLQSAHFPYHNPAMEQLLPGRPIPRAKIALANRKWVEATYWNAVAQADAQIGMLIARLKALGAYDDSLLVVTADHGESLFDDGFLGHGHMLNRQQTHIPLVVNVPGAANGAPIGLAGYRGLILRLLGADVPRSSAAPVLQYIGTLDRPSHVGMVEPGQRWTVLQVQERRVSFSEQPGSYGYEELASKPALKARADRLIAAWERERWLNHIRK